VGAQRFTPRSIRQQLVEEAADHVVAGFTSRCFYSGTGAVCSRGSDQAFAGTRRLALTQAEPLAASSVRGLNSRWGVNGIRNTLEHYFMPRNRKIAVIWFYYVRLPMDATVPCSKLRAVPVIQEMAVGEK
jgi:hypothetical protein